MWCLVFFMGKLEEELHRNRERERKLCSTHEVPWVNRQKKSLKLSTKNTRKLHYSQVIKQIKWSQQWTVQCRNTTAVNTYLPKLLPKTWVGFIWSWFILLRLIVIKLFHYTNMTTLHQHKCSVRDETLQSVLEPVSHWKQVGNISFPSVFGGASTPSFRAVMHLILCVLVVNWWRCIQFNFTFVLVRVTLSLIVSLYVCTFNKGKKPQR